MTIKKPMLADNKDWDPVKVEGNLPLAAFIKLDGIRCLVHDGVGYSRSLKPLPNQQLQAKIAQYAEQLEGFDGEIIIGSFTDEFCFKKSHRSCMKGDLSAEDPAVYEHRFICFDLWNEPDLTYEERHQKLSQRAGLSQVPFVEVLEYDVLTTYQEVLDFAEEALDYGHEGSIFRRLDALYKHGRATTNCGGLYKNKSVVDTEIIVTAFHELMTNNNPKEVNELGRTKRSTHQANLVPGGTLGAVEGTGKFPDGRPFTVKVGVFKGFTKEDLQNIWNKRDQFLGRPLKIKYMLIGSDEAPRTPRALGFRDPIDMS